MRNREVDTTGRMVGFAGATGAKRVIKSYGKPKITRVDHWLEFVARALDLWAYLDSVTLDFSRAGVKKVDYLTESKQVCLFAFFLIPSKVPKCEGGIPSRFRRNVRLAA